MSDVNAAGEKNSGLSPEAGRKREAAQVTLSAIGDVSIAASEVISGAREIRTGSAWAGALIFFLLVYALGAGLGRWLAADWPDWRTLAVPLLPALCAAGAYWWGRRWKLRARDSGLKLKIWQDALESLGHEAANAVNAIRGNLKGFRLVNPHPATPEHLDEIETGADRIDAVVQKSRDPVAWKEKKQKPSEESASPALDDTPSRISL